MNEDSRISLVAFRVSAIEKLELELAAKKLGMTKSDFIRASVFKNY